MKPLPPLWWLPRLKQARAYKFDIGWNWRISLKAFSPSCCAIYSNILTILVAAKKSSKKWIKGLFVYLQWKHHTDFKHRICCSPQERLNNKRNKEVCSLYQQGHQDPPPPLPSGNTSAGSLSLFSTDLSQVKRARILPPSLLPELFSFKC